MCAFARVIVWLCVSVCAVCAYMCIGNFLIALILRHMHRHARLVSCLFSAALFFPCPLSPSLSLFCSSSIYSCHPFTRNIHVRRSTALLNLLPDAVAAVALPCLASRPPDIHIFQLLFLLLVACITHQECVCVCVCKHVRASVDKAQKSYTC